MLNLIVLLDSAHRFGLKEGSNISSCDAKINFILVSLVSV